MIVTGETREPDQTPGTPNGGGTGGTGSGGSGTGSGSGDGTSGAAGSGSSGSAARKPPALRAERPESDERFSADPTSGAGKTIVQGILLAGSGATIEGGLPGGASAGSPRPATGVTGTADDPSTILICVVLALAFVLLGALRERRNVRLRVA